MIFTQMQKESIIIEKAFITKSTVRMTRVRLIITSPSVSDQILLGVHLEFSIEDHQVVNAYLAILLLVDFSNMILEVCKCSECFAIRSTFWTYIVKKFEEFLLYVLVFKANAILSVQ